MFDSLTDLGNASLIGSASPDALRSGDTTKPSIHEPNPTHTRFLYFSGRRPLGMWFDPDWEYSHISGDRSSSVIGRTDPLSMKALREYELRPVDALTRAASVVRAWDLEETLASFAGTRRDPSHVNLLEKTAPGTYTLTTYNEWSRLATLSFMIDGDGPYAEGEGTVLKAVRMLLEDDLEMLDAKHARYVLRDWKVEAKAAA